MKYEWNYKDCIDLEYLIEIDKTVPDTELHRRDRDIFLQNDSENDSKRLKKVWLEKRRQTVNDGFLPGKIAGEAFSLLRLGTLVALLFSGFASGLAYFTYSGNAPVNVFPFFAVFIILQLFLVLLTVLRLLVWKISSRSTPRSSMLSLFSVLVRKLLNFSLSQAGRSLTARQQTAIQTLFGRGRRYTVLYRTLLTRTLFVLFQAGGVSFNIGLLAATLTKVSISDIAFGWQSTLQFSTHSLHSVVKLIATPWSWLFGEGTGYPTFAEIEGSHIVLKEGIEHLATHNLISWWPFLLLSVAVYGLGLRLLLTVLGYFYLRRAQRSFTPDSAAVERIVRRMRTPLVSSQAQNKKNAARAPDEHQNRSRENASRAAQLADILIPDECFDLYSNNELQKLLHDKGFSLGAIHRFQIDYEGDQVLLETLKDKKKDIGSIIIFVEAWMPPLMDLLSFLAELRSALAADTLIVLWLIGKPSEQTIFTPVEDPVYRKIWNQKIEQLGDPYLDIIAPQNQTS